MEAPQKGTQSTDTSTEDTNSLPESVGSKISEESSEETSSEETNWRFPFEVTTTDSESSTTETFEGSEGLKFITAIGATGAGKSTSMNMLVGEDKTFKKPFTVGNQIASETDRIKLVRSKLKKGIIVVDTPGLADTNGKGEEYMQDILKFLNQHGGYILYFIRQNRPGPRSLEAKQIKALAEALGRNSNNFVILVRTAHDVSLDKTIPEMETDLQTWRKELESDLDITFKDVIGLGQLSSTGAFTPAMFIQTVFELVDSVEPLPPQSLRSIEYSEKPEIKTQKPEIKAQQLEIETPPNPSYVPSYPETTSSSYSKKGYSDSEHFCCFVLCVLSGGASFPLWLLCACLESEC